MRLLLSLFELIFELIEFLTAPIGLTASLWIGFYFLFIQILDGNPVIAALLPAILTIDLYISLKQLDH